MACGREVEGRRLGLTQDDGVGWEDGELGV